MNSKHTLEKLGLKVIDDQPYDFSATSGKQCYGQLWENPEFTDFEGMLAAAERAPEAIRVPAEQKGIDFGGRHFVTVNGVYTACVTDRYKLVQHKEINMMATEAARAMKLGPVGGIEYEGGRMTGHVVFTGADQQVQLLKDTGEDIAVGAKWFNSYGGDRGVGVESFGIRTICCNYNAWGRQLGRVYATHAKPQADEIEQAFWKMLDASTKLPAIINSAKEELVPEESLVDLLWGIRFPESHIMGGSRTKYPLVPNLTTWEPAITTDGLTRWNLYNAATAVLTHGASIGSYGVEAFSARATKLLTGNLDDLIENGAEHRAKVLARRVALATGQPSDEDGEEAE